MKHQVSSFSVDDRPRQKQASREDDASRLKNGEISREDLRKANSFFGVLKVQNFRIAAVGRKSLERTR